MALHPRRLPWIAAIAISLAALPAHAALLSGSGDFVSYVEGLRNLAFAEDSNLYVAPDAGEQTAFGQLATDLWEASTPDDITALVAAAANLEYDVVSFTDTGTGYLYLGLREQLVSGTQQTGWGSYFVKQGLWRDVMVQAPHPIADTRSWEVAAHAYRAAEARGFLLAGAHRNANGVGTADVADPIGSIFEVVHEQWNGPGGEVTAWQVHGFDLDNYPTYPASTDAVLSNGTGLVSAEILALDAALENAGQGWISFAYNTLDPLGASNVAVNGTFAGTLFGPPGGLGATTNAQQDYSTGIGGTLVHIELEQSIRLTGSANRIIAGNAIAAAIEATYTLVPEPSAALLVAIGTAGLWTESAPPTVTVPAAVPKANRPLRASSGRGNSTRNHHLLEAIP